MEQQLLAAEKRTETKKGGARRSRRAGKIPAVIYGHSGTAPLVVDEHEFETRFREVSENTIIRLTVGSDTYDVLVKDYQEDIITGKVLQEMLGHSHYSTTMDRYSHVDQGLHREASQKMDADFW